MKPYIYTDEDGHDLTLESFAVGAGVATEETIFVYKDHLPEVVGKLYEAAGLTAPVMLARPGPPLLDALLRHYQGASDMHTVRADLLHERGRVDKLTDAMIKIAAKEG